jgi:hypothetical protein
LNDSTLTADRYDSGEISSESLRENSDSTSAAEAVGTRPDDLDNSFADEAIGEHRAAPIFDGLGRKLTDLGQEWLPAIISASLHLSTLIVLALVLGDVPAPPPPSKHIIEAAVVEELPRIDSVSIELEKQLVELNDRPPVSFSSGFALDGAVSVQGVAGGGFGDGSGTGGGGNGSGSVGISAPAMDASILASAGGGSDELGIGDIISGLPSSSRLITAVPDGQVGEARSVVGNYQEALDQLTQEVLWMLDKNDVLLLWAFDQSESMKDDQQEVRERLEHVYKQLGLVSQTSQDSLQTAVVSFGENYIQHTVRPTSNLDEVRSAINEVPIDKTGTEMTCSAVLQAIATHRGYARKTKRQMALVLITDESGDRTDNDRNLERAIAEAKAARCKIFVLGREAVFGYPYAHIRWIHPQTKHHHWIAIDRGPESAFVEQLQTDGFHRRHDAHSSGAGPYECTRLARETSGVFFMLPSVESELVHSDKRRYELEAMKPYLPDLRSRLEVAVDRDKSRMQTMLTKVIYDLNPYNEEAAKIIEMRVHFSPQPASFVQQARQEQAKAIVYLQYLANAEKEVGKFADERRYEPAPRWQANYDLLYAQLIAYQARMYEYGAYLEDFIKNPKTVPAFRAPNLTHTRWDIQTRQKIITGKKVDPYIERATRMFKEIVEKHPGTPWAARAEVELSRGFGVELVEVYDGPDPVIPAGTPVVPIPKL